MSDIAIWLAVEKFFHCAVKTIVIYTSDCYSSATNYKMILEDKIHAHGGKTLD